MNRIIRYLMMAGAALYGVESPFPVPPPIIPPLIDPSCSSYGVPNYQLHAQNKYMTYGSCEYGDRSSSEFCDALEPYLQHLGYKCNGKYYDRNTDWMTFEPNDANLKVWAGHGFAYNSTIGIHNHNSGTLHFYNWGGENHPVGIHYYSVYNTSWYDILYNEWGWDYDNPDAVDYFVAFTCNFLKFNPNPATYTENPFAMFDGGMHLIVGFASTMYIDPLNGSWFGYYLKYEGRSIVDSWRRAAEQVQLKWSLIKGFNCKVAWAGHVAHINDTLAPHADPPGWDGWNKPSPGYDPNYTYQTGDAGM